MRSLTEDEVFLLTCDDTIRHNDPRYDEIMRAAWQLHKRGCLSYENREHTHHFQTTEHGRLALRVFRAFKVTIS